jgi:hypothetical protein
MHRRSDAAKQRSSEAAKQRSSEAAKQRSSEAAKQRSSEAGGPLAWESLYDIYVKKSQQQLRVCQIVCNSV